MARPGAHPVQPGGHQAVPAEARRKVWGNTRLLAAARRQGPDALAARLAELEELSRRRVTELKVPGQVLLKLAVKGFGVRLVP